MAHTFRILTLNNIAQVGLKRFPAGKYEVGSHVKDPDAILVRSHDMHAMEIAPQVKAIARAGAGTNNIPVKQMSARGVPVFNAPGANANAVKELVIAGMLIAARNLLPASHFVAGLTGDDAPINQQVEDGKKQFAGVELPRHTLGVIGLGKVGSLVADAAIKLGMNVLGYDPHITVDAAWSLPSQVKKAHSVEEVLKNCEFVTLHVPLVDATRNLISHERIKLMKHGAILLNFSRDGIVDNDAVLEGLSSKRLKYYVCDFPAQQVRRASGRDRVAASGRVDARGGGQLRDHGGRSVARLSRERQHPECGQLSRRGDGARIAVPRRHRQCQCAEHAGPDLDRDGGSRAQHPQHAEQVQRRDGLYAGRRRQRGAGAGGRAYCRDQRRARRCVICRRRRPEDNRG